MQSDVYIIQDFENIDQVTLMQNSFVQFGANMDFNIQNDFAAQGQNYFRMRGEMTWNEWFLGNLVLDIDEAQALPNLTPSTTNVPFHSFPRLKKYLFTFLKPLFSKKLIHISELKSSIVSTPVFSFQL